MAGPWHSRLPTAHSNFFNDEQCVQLETWSTDTYCLSYLSACLESWSRFALLVHVWSRQVSSIIDVFGASRSDSRPIPRSIETAMLYWCVPKPGVPNPTWASNFGTDPLNTALHFDLKVCKGLVFPASFISRGRAILIRTSFTQKVGAPYDVRNHVGYVSWLCHFQWILEWKPPMVFTAILCGCNTCRSHFIFRKLPFQP